MKFHVVQMVQIPESCLTKGIIKELIDRECFVDTDQELKEQIFSADVFETIACEQAEILDHSFTKLDKESLKLLDELAEQFGEFEYIQVTKI